MVWRNIQLIFLGDSAVLREDDADNLCNAISTLASCPLFFGIESVFANLIDFSCVAVKSTPQSRSIEE